jgi:hypothetical protein
MPEAFAAREKLIACASVGVGQSADAVRAGKYSILGITELTRLLPRFETRKQTLSKYKRVS